MKVFVSGAELQELLGSDMFRAFMMRYAGYRVYIPVLASHAHNIAKVVGYEGMQALCARYGGHYIDLPSARKHETLKKAVLRLLEGSKKTKSEIAHELGCSLRYVEHITAELKRKAQAPKQCALL